MREMSPGVFIGKPLAERMLRPIAATSNYENIARIDGCSFGNWARVTAGFIGDNSCQRTTKTHVP